jgi:hypothetical protein
MRLLTLLGIATLVSTPLACGGDDEGGGSSGSAGTGGAGATGGTGGTGGSGTGATGGGAGSGTGGGAGSSTGGAAGSASGGAAGSSSGGAAGNASGGSAGGGPTNPVSEACKTCWQQNCATQVQQCQANATCTSCVNQDYTASACDSESHYQALCTCGVTGGGPCHNECGSFC